MVLFLPKIVNELVLEKLFSAVLNDVLTSITASLNRHVYGCLF